MIQIRTLTPDQVDDWLDFFDHRAFTDNPDWGGCYCRCFLFGPADGDDPDPWGTACDAGLNRRPMAEAIRAGEVDGLLARDGDTVVGWVHFGPTARFRSVRGALEPVGDGIASIVCFVVAASHRRQGVARALLREALEELRRRGFEQVDVRPRREDGVEAMDLFRGPRALYESEGFVLAGEDGSRVRLRRALRLEPRGAVRAQP